MNEVRDELIKKGSFLMKSGAYEAARATFLDALKIDPLHKVTYACIGNVAYLMGQQGLAVRSYLALTHLRLYEIENDLRDQTLSEELQKFYDKLPKDDLQSLPLESAFVIYLDAHITRDVAHALIDLTEARLEANPELKPYAEMYRTGFEDKEKVNAIIQEHQITKEAYMKIEKKTYIPFGQAFLLKEIDWDKIFRNDVINIYFQDPNKK